MIAYTLVNTVADIEDSGTDALSYSAGGFKDFTRIASSSPEMWTDICVMNKGPIVKMIEGFQSRLETLKRLISDGDLNGLKEDFERAKKVRDSLLEK
jgi:prephenate dehydrogenase